MVTSNRVTVAVFLQYDLDLRSFDLWVNACRVTTIEYTCTRFGVNSSSRFPYKAQTNRHD